MLFTCLYIGVFIFSGKETELPTELNTTFIIFILGLVFLSWLVRYLRWWILLSSIQGKTQFIKGFFCYLSGFAYTASPGKAGELSRIILYKKLLVKPEHVVSCFFTERSVDLIVVLLLSLFIILTFTEYIIVPIIALLIIALLLLLIFNDTVWRHINSLGTKLGFAWLQSCIAFSNQVRSRILEVNKPLLLMTSFLLGIISWGLIAYSFIAVCRLYSVETGQWFLFGVYPFAMLVGAISFIPGGIGSTEAAITALLISQGVASEQAISIALLIRICTLWSAVWVGMGCMLSGIAFMQKINVQSSNSAEMDVKA